MTARDRGTTAIADRAVRRIAEQAAREAVAGSGGRVTGGSASVHGTRADVSVGIALAYRGSAGEATRAVREHVAARTAHLTGLRLPAPRVRIREFVTAGGPGPAEPEDTGPPEDPATGTSAHAAPPGGTTAGTGAAATAGDTGAAVAPGGAPKPGRRWYRTRSWSERRLPAGLLAVLAVTGAAALLREVAAVRLLGHPPAPWRRQLLGLLTANGPADTPVWAAAALVPAGLWLVALALTPGRRGALVMAAPEPGVRAVVRRRPAGRLVRTALAEVPGVTGVRVRAGRRRMTVRAELAHGDRAQADAQVADAVAAAVRGLGLAAPLRTRVRLRTAPAWRPADAAPGEGGPDGPLA